MSETKPRIIINEEIVCPNCKHDLRVKISKIVIAPAVPADTDQKIEVFDLGRQDELDLKDDKAPLKKKKEVTEKPAGKKEMPKKK